MINNFRHLQNDLIHLIFLLLFVQIIFHILLKQDEYIYAIYQFR